MHKFKVGDKVVVKYNRGFVEMYDGCIGPIVGVTENSRCPYIIQMHDEVLQVAAVDDIIPFTGFKVGDIVECLTHPHLWGMIIKNMYDRITYITKEGQHLIDKEEYVKYHRSHFEKETNMLDKEKLHKLVDGIDPEKYNKVDAYVQTKGDVIEERLIQLQKEKSLEERLREAGYSVNQPTKVTKVGQIYVISDGEIVQVCVVHKGCANEILYCQPDFDKIMETIRFLEGRE